MIGWDGPEKIYEGVMEFWLISHSVNHPIAAQFIEWLRYSFQTVELMYSHDTSSETVFFYMSPHEATILLTFVEYRIP